MRSPDTNSRWIFASVIITLFYQTTWAQISVNGQIFTDGLSIIDSPALNTPFSAGSTLPIAIDVSGDGQLSSAAEVPGSDLATRYDLLEIYLVSSETNINVTVSAGPALLTNETGTVRHDNWDIPSCLPAGNYNLTFYESSHIDNKAYFAITPIPITINSSGGQDSCSYESNPLQDQPQASSPVSQSPFLPASALTTLEYISTGTLVTTSSGQPTTKTFTATFTTTMVAGQTTSSLVPVNSSHRNEAWPVNFLILSISCLPFLLQLLLVG